MSDRTHPFRTGTLWPTLVERTRAALACGALQPIETEAHVVEEAGVAFQVRIVSSLVRKHAHGEDLPAGADPGRPNPFLPYENDLYVADVSDTHVCLLNKYNVIDHHLLIITRAFEPQERVLTRADFAALARCLAEFEALGFYNSGAVAGASQPHKHLQLVPLPLAGGPAPIPLDALVPFDPPTLAPTHLPGLPFRHAFIGLDRAGALAPDRLAARYRELLAAAGLDPAAPEPGPYNLLVTRRYMMLVPRRVDRYRDVPVNALGFAGSFFVRHRRQLETLREVGPMTALRGVTLPFPAGS